MEGSGDMTEQYPCFFCGCFIVRTKGHHDFDKSKGIEVEEIECQRCRQITQIPLYNKLKQLRLNMESLSNGQ